MKKNLFLLITAGILAGSCTPKNAEEAATGEAKSATQTTGEEYALNLEESTIFWRGTKPGGEHTGTIAASKGFALAEGDKLIGGSITIDLNSIVNDDLTGDMNARLVGHLKSEDFFYTEQYPEAIFEITSVDRYEGETTGDEWTPTNVLTGNLTMRGITKSISFPVKIEHEAGNLRVISHEFAIDRTIWGINFKSKSVFAEFKDDFISDMMNITVKAIFTK